MYNIIDRFMSNLTVDKVNDFAKSKNINLSNDELIFTYNFLKRNYKEFIKNPALFDLDRYQNKYSKENFTKIKKVFIEYFSKYQKYL